MQIKVLKEGAFNNDLISFIRINDIKESVLKAEAQLIDLAEQLCSSSNAASPQQPATAAGESSAQTPPTQASSTPPPPAQPVAAPPQPPPAVSSSTTKPQEKPKREEAKVTAPAPIDTTPSPAKLYFRRLTRQFERLTNPFFSPFIGGEAVQQERVSKIKDDIKKFEFEFKIKIPNIPLARGNFFAALEFGRMLLEQSSDDHRQQDIDIVTCIIEKF